MLLWKILSGSVYELVLITAELIILQHDGQLICKLRKGAIFNGIVKVLPGSVYKFNII